MKNRYTTLVQTVEKRVLWTQKKLRVLPSINAKNLYSPNIGKNVLVVKTDKSKQIYRYVARFKGMKMCSLGTYVKLQKRGFSGADIVQEQIPVYSPRLISLRFIKKD
jgi:hypothetical protein